MRRARRSAPGASSSSIRISPTPVARRSVASTSRARSPSREPRRCPAPRRPRRRARRAASLALRSRHLRVHEQSCTFLRAACEPIARPPAAHLEAGAGSTRAPHAPAVRSTGPLQPDARRTRAPPGRRRRGRRASSPRGDASSSASAARACAAGAAARPRARSRFSRRAGCELLAAAAGSRSRIRPRFVSAFDESIAERAARARGSTPPSPRARRRAAAARRRPRASA